MWTKILFLILFIEGRETRYIIRNGYNNEPALEVVLQSEGTWYYRSTGTNSNTDLSMWEATNVVGYSSIGHHPQTDWSDDLDGILSIAKDISGDNLTPALKQPTGFHGPVWTDEGTGGSTQLAFWTPDCPDGYVSLSDVAQPSYSTPPLNIVRCVRRDLVEQCEFESSPVWDDRGSGAQSDCSLWRMASLDNTGIFTQFFRTSSKKYDEPTSQAWCLKELENITETDARYIVRDGYNDDPALEVVLQSEGTWYYRSTGTNSNTDLSMWEATNMAGYSSIGHHPQTNWSDDLEDILPLARDISGDSLTPALKQPTDFSGPVWTDRGTGGSTDIAFWTPDCPDGYVSLSDVAQPNYSTPPLNIVRCVRRDLVEPCQFESSPVWEDRGSGATNDCSLWRMTSDVNSGLYVQFFRTSSNYNAPTSPAWCLKELEEVSNRKY